MMIFSAKAQPPNYFDPHLEEVADLSHFQAIGLAVSSTNRLFVGFPHRNDPYEYGLVEIIDGKRVPYPNAEWNSEKGAVTSHFLNVQDLFIDSDDYLWALDSKPTPQNSVFKDKDSSAKGEFKLVKINIQNHTVENVYTFDGIDKQKSALNDVRIDTEKQLAYLSDPGLAALVILDLVTGNSRTVLQNTPFTLAKEHVILSYEGHDMRTDEGIPFRSNVNGIALTKDFTQLYFKPINEYTLYRIATQYLADAELTGKELETHVENVGTTVITHGLEADENKNIYLTSSVDYSIKYIDAKGFLPTLVQDKRLLWPDSLGIGSDGYLYVTCAQLQREAIWNKGINRTLYPYKIFRIKRP